jgi:hypothetical protein
MATILADKKSQGLVVAFEVTSKVMSNPNLEPVVLVSTLVLVRPVVPVSTTNVLMYANLRPINYFGHTRNAPAADSRAFIAFTPEVQPLLNVAFLISAL